MTINEKTTAELKASLLSEGISFNLDLFTNYKGNFYENQYVYGKTSDKVTRKHRLPQVLLLGERIITALLCRENSPWNLKIEDGEIVLYHEDRYVKTVHLPEKPAYFGKKLKDGTPTENIVAVAGEDTPGFFLYPHCYYFSEGVPCGFCSLKNTRKTVAKNLVSNFNGENIAEATRIFQDTPWRDIPLISISTGTCVSDEETRENVIKPIKAMYEALDPKIPIHVLAHPPNDFGLVDEYKEAGVTTIAFDLEIFDRGLFEKICPGKEKYYGYDRWLQSLDYARDTFGDYKAFCGLIWGLEPPESTIKGNKYFLDRGIGIASNIFHADPKCILRNHEQPSEEDILKISRAQSDLYLRYPSAKTIFPVSMRSTLDWEIYRGDFR